MLLTLKPPANLTRYTSTITRLLIPTTKTSTSFSLESRNSKGSRSVVHARSINTSMALALESLFTHGYLVSGMLETPCSMYQEAKRVFYSGSSCEKRWRKNNEWPNIMLTSNTPLLWQHFKKLPMQLIASTKSLAHCSKHMERHINRLQNGNSGGILTMVNE